MTSLEKQCMEAIVEYKKAHLNVDNGGRRRFALACENIKSLAPQCREALANPVTCKWTVDKYNDELYITSCTPPGSVTPHLAFAPSETGWKFCPWCGKQIEVVK